MPEWPALPGCVSQGRTKEKALANIREAIELALETRRERGIPQAGSHRQFKHPTKPGRVTIAGNLNDDLAPGTLNSILKQAQLKKEG